MQESPAHMAEVTNLSFNSTERYMISGGSDYLVNVWDIDKA